MPDANRLDLWMIKRSLLLTSLALMALTSTKAQQGMWQIGVDAQFVFAHYQATDPGSLLSPVFNVPTGTGRLVLNRSLNERGLWLESGVGYRQIPQATASFNGVSTINGVGLWYLPIGLRQDVISLLFPQHHFKFRLALMAGLLNQFATPEGVEKATFGETGPRLSLSGHSTLTNRYCLALYTGIELRFPFRRVDLLMQWGQIYGFSEILKTQIDYQFNGINRQASISNSGSACNGLGVGIRYHFGGR